MFIDGQGTAPTSFTVDMVMEKLSHIHDQIIAFTQLKFVTV
jgi:hypothetical protein